MILDLPVETVQAIIAKAEMQGVTPAQMLARDYKPFPNGYSETEFNAIFHEIEKHGLNSDSENIVLNEENAKVIQELLDNPPPPNPYMQQLLALGQQYV